MKETKTQTLYTSPEVKMVEIKARKMLCASGDGNLQQYNNGSWSWETE